MRQRRVLILSDLFPPVFAPRIQAVAKYLPTYGWEPVVATELVRHQADYVHTATDSRYKEDIPIYRIDFGKNEVGTLRHKLNFLADLVYERRERRMEKALQKSLKEKPDVILCFAYRKFPLRTAARLAKSWGIPWIADCRDIVEQYTDGDFLPHPITLWGHPLLKLMRSIRARIISQRNRYLSQANKVITVSPWHRNLLAKVNPDCHLIYNGYDHEIFSPRLEPHPHFDIIYTGRLLSLSMRDPSLLFQALASPELSELVSSSKLHIHWYTDKQSERLLRPVISSYGLETINTFHEMLPREEMARMIQSAAILLQLSNRESESGPHGMVSTKIFEAMAVRKPVLLVRSDEAVMEQLIKHTRIGCAARSVRDVISFVRSCHKDWIRQGYTAVSGEQEEIELFSRKRQVGDFARLLNEVLDNPKNIRSCPYQSNH
ncbi:Uncharacterised protein [Porphyromonas crevioricanis]|uniref:Glycosyltransferase subfamily 4-like N-terminal domain-containing protein n=1 Tax=Porphyromonas crevioricanis TaxID=393921 RepID=A0A2X4PH53_9PORP|nr:glycosyltransferase [Porphyromonas crevioricanis]GAD06803.1 hypothetical protein PORCAN_411 [Porphyromonas crevioricanis JCM 13913]SQH73246.1 Uncharacterised protein [Porphyromonas crevioricanis]